MSATDPSKLKEQTAFINRLLESAAPEAAEQHFRLLADHSDERFRQMLFAAYRRRGPPGVEPLVNYIKNETAGELTADAIKLLGLLQASEQSFLISRQLDSENVGVREAAAISLGWLGRFGEAKLLAEHFESETEPRVRLWIPSSLRQIFWAKRSSAAQLVPLFLNFAKETNNDVRAMIVVSLTDISGVQFGLRENAKTAVIAGSVETAWPKAVSHLNSL
jgi:HEAT repeat protein